MLKLSKEEREMANNYFTILRNTIPEVWFDSGIELGGGMPFTVGNEGIERNYRHIVSLENAYSLNLFILRDQLSAAQLLGGVVSANRLVELPYISTGQVSPRANF